MTRNEAHDWLSDPNQCAKCGKKRLLSLVRNELYEALSASANGKFGGWYRAYELLIENPDLIKGKDDFGCTPWHYLANSYCSDKPKPTEIEEQGTLVRAFFVSAEDKAKEGREWLLKFLLREDKDGTPLQLFCNSYEALSVLFEFGVKIPPGRDKNGDTLAHRVNDPKILQLLLANGADVDGRNERGNTALWSAAIRGQLDKVRVLLRYKADPNAETSGETPLKAVSWWRNRLCERPQSLLTDTRELFENDKLGELNRLEAEFVRVKAEVDAEVAVLDRVSAVLKWYGGHL
jgi:hypothetical protein